MSIYVLVPTADGVKCYKTPYQDFDTVPSKCVQDSESSIRTEYNIWEAISEQKPVHINDLMKNLKPEDKVLIQILASTEHLSPVECEEMVRSLVKQLWLLDQEHKDRLRGVTAYLFDTFIKKYLPGMYLENLKNSMFDFYQDVLRLDIRQPVLDKLDVDFLSYEQVVRKIFFQKYTTA